MTGEHPTPGERFEASAPGDQEDPTVRILLRITSGTWPGEGVAGERVRAHWRSVIVARRRRRRVQAAALAAALGGLLVLAGTLWLPAPTPSGFPGGPVASIELIVPLLPPGAPGAPSPLLRVGSRTAAAGTEVTSGDAVETSPQALVALRAGATSIRLDAATRLRLLPGRRIELERGAVYLDTPPGGAHAGGFEVLTAAGTFRELGTQFEVRAEGKAVRIRVREGAIEFRAANGGTRRVEASHELLAEPLVAATVRPTASTGPGWEWAARAAPRPPLGDATLAELLAWVSRETGSEITYVHEEDSVMARSAVLHGPLEGLDPVSALAVALPTCGLEGRFVEGRLVIDRLP